MSHIMKTQKTFEGESNQSDRDIGLFDLEQIVIIKEALE